MKTAIVLAGGKGTRLGPRMPPKAMLKICGKTLIDRQISWLVSEGFEKIILCLGHRWKEIRWQEHDGVRIVPNIEVEPLGTAGCIKNAFSNTYLILDLAKENFFYVMNVDDVCNVRTGEALFESSADSPLIVCKSLPYSVHVDDRMFNQHQCFVHMGHFVLSRESIHSLPDRGDLPGWLMAQIKVNKYVTSAEWLTVNTMDQLWHMRRALK